MGEPLMAATGSRRGYGFVGEFDMLRDRRYDVVGCTVGRECIQVGEGGDPPYFRRSVVQRMGPTSISLDVQVELAWAKEIVAGRA